MEKKLFPISIFFVVICSCSFENEAIEPGRRTPAEFRTMGSRDATGGRFETLDLRRVLPMKF